MSLFSAALERFQYVIAASAMPPRATTSLRMIIDMLVAVLPNADAMPNDDFDETARFGKRITDCRDRPIPGRNY